MRKIYVSDFTLSKLAGERKNPLLFREKTAIAVAIDGMGVDAIELAPIKNIKEDTIIYKTIAANVKNAALCLPAGDTAESVQAAWEAVKGAEKPCLQVVLPLSTVQMEYIYHIKSNKMLPKIEELVKCAKSYCGCVEFVALDATRAEEEFLAEAVKTAVECGACAVTVCDDAGVSLPNEFASFIKKVKDIAGVPVYAKVNNTLKMAVATAFAAIEAGADGVKTVITGTNELKLDDFAAAAAAKGEQAGICTGLVTTSIPTDVRALTKKIKSTEVETVSSSVSPEADIFLDGDSSPEQIAAACAALGYELTSEDLGNVERGLRRVCEKKGSVGAPELEAVIASYSMRAPSTYHLESFIATTGNSMPSMAHVILTGEGGSEISGSGVGDGPIDAAFSAIEQAVGFHYELDEFSINTVTRGKESLGSALIKLRSNGKLYSGNGLSTNIVGACIRAYVNALNKIVYDKNDEEE